MSLVNKSDYDEYPTVPPAGLTFGNTFPMRYKRIYRDTPGDDFFPLYYFTKEDFPIGTDDFYYTIGGGEANRLDWLSYKFYNTTALWWVIATVNDISDPLTDAVVGKSLRIPHISRVYSILISKVR